jgi:hypothetical protein
VRVDDGCIPLASVLAKPIALTVSEPD